MSDDGGMSRPDGEPDETVAFTGSPWRLGSSIDGQSHCPICAAINDDQAGTTVKCSSCSATYDVVSVDHDGLDPTGTTRTLGRFRLKRIVGRGAFGVVYQAEDPELEIDVAIKIPRLGIFRTEDEQRRFLSEPRHAARLIHPNIVRIHDVGQAGEVPYIVSEFIDGSTLEDRLKKLGKPKLVEAIDLIVTLAEALHYAHEQGIIHRDIKPGNILLDPHGIPHLADFGLAQRTDSCVTVTADGQVLGTPAYMSPEQARGDTSQVDARSDVYSLGVVLFELLTGERPFRGVFTALMTQVVQYEAPDPRTLNSSVPIDVATICLRCLEKDPSRRFASAQELANDLQRFANHEPIHSRQIAIATRFARWCKRRPAVALLWSMVLMIALVAPVVAIQQFVLGERAVQSERAARHLLYTSDMNVTDYVLRTGNVLVAQSLLDRHIPQANETDQRRFEWYLLRSRCRRSQDVRTIDTDDSTHQFSYSPTNHVVATPGQKGLKIWDIESGTLIHQIGDRAVGRVAYSRDGSLIASGSSDGRVVVHATGDYSEASACQVDENVSALAFHTGNSTVAIGQSSGEVQLWNWTTDKLDPVAEAVNERPLLEWSHLAVTAIRFSADGRLFATARRNGVIEIWSHSDRKRLRRIYYPRGLFGLEFSPDGTRLAACYDYGLTVLWEVGTGAKIAEFWHGGGENRSASFSPDGTRLAVCGTDSTIRIWNIEHQYENQRLIGHDAIVTDVVFSADGSQVLSISNNGKILIWDLANWNDYQRAHSDVVSALAFSPDDSTLLSGGWDRRLNVWNVRSASVITQIDDFEDRVRVIRYAPNQRLVALSTGTDIQLLDTTNWQRIGTLRGHGTIIDSIDMSPNGKEMVSVDRSGKVISWNVEAKTWTSEFWLAERVVALRYLPNGATVIGVTASGQIVQWDVRSGAVQSEVECDLEKIESMTISRDRRYVAAVSVSDTRAVLFDVVANNVSMIPAPQGSFSAVFSPDSRTCILGGVQSSITFWDVVERRTRCSLYAVGDAIVIVAMSSDGNLLVTGGGDGSVCFLRADR